MIVLVDNQFFAAIRYDKIIFCIKSTQKSPVFPAKKTAILTVAKSNRNGDRDCARSVSRTP